MPINVIARDIVNFPGGTPKTITADIAQIVPVEGNPEGDEVWVSSTTTTATASGGGSIESIFKNSMKRGFLRSSGLISGQFDIGASARMEVAIDEDLGSGLEIELDQGNNMLGADVAQDIESKIRNAAKIGEGGAKAGNLSYLNCQVRFTNGKFEIESGTTGSTFTGTGKSSVAVGPPALGNDVRATLGLDIVLTSESLAGREIIETDLTSAYTTGDTLTMTSTAGFSAGDPFTVTDGTNSSIALVSGTESASVMRFTSVSGAGEGLSSTYAIGSMVRKMHLVDVADPVSAVTTIDGLYRFGIDSIVNQINFGA